MYDHFKILLNFFLKKWVKIKFHFFYPDTDCGLEVVKSKITTA